MSHCHCAQLISHGLTCKGPGPGNEMPATDRLRYGTGNGEVLPITSRDSPDGEQIYICTLPSTSTLDEGWVVSTTPRPLYPPGKTRYPLYSRLGGPQGRSGLVRKISSLPTRGFDPRTVQPVASRYTD